MPRAAAAVFPLSPLIEIISRGNWSEKISCLCNVQTKATIFGNPINKQHKKKYSKRTKEWEEMFYQEPQRQGQRQPPWQEPPCPSRLKPLSVMVVNVVLLAMGMVIEVVIAMESTFDSLSTKIET